MALQGSNLKQQIGDASPGSSFGTIGSSPGHVYQVHHSAVPDAAPNYANQYSDNSVHAPQQGSADGMPTYQQTLALSMRGLNMNGIAAVSPHRMTHEETLPQVMSMSGVHSEFPVDSAGVEQQQQDWYRAQMQPSNGSVVDGAPQVRISITKSRNCVGNEFPFAYRSPSTWLPPRTWHASIVRRRTMERKGSISRRLQPRLTMADSRGASQPRTGTHTRWL